MRLSLHLLMCLIWLGLTLPAMAQHPDTGCAPEIRQVLAAPEHTPGARPADGWQPVSLPESRFSSARWGSFRGAVWYQLTWRNDCPGRSVALSIDRIFMAGEVWLNDDLLWRDANVAEPLSRSWNMPRYWLLPAAALQDDNTLWIRVAGSAHTVSRLGSVQLGAPEIVRPAFEKQRWIQRDLTNINLLISLMLGGLFLTFWLLRRKEHAFGWFALASMMWSLGISNMLVTSAWPFDDSDTWDRLSMLGFILYCPAFCMFLWAFSGRCYPRLARWLWASAALMCVLVMLPPAQYITHLQAAVLLYFRVIFTLACLHFVLYAWRCRESNQILLALCLACLLALGVLEALTLSGVVDMQREYVQLSAPIISVAMFLILAMRFARSLRRIEAFNEELQTRVADTRAELTRTLQREHRLEADNIRLNERLRITHDLHDSLGSSLLHSIALVDQSRNLGGEKFLAILRELRTDLRQVIDGASFSMALEHGTPAQWIAPLRRRFGGLFDDLDIHSQWHLPADWPCVLPTQQLLGLTRFLEEALTNVLKHSHATQLEVRLEALPDSHGLRLEVTDNGRGFDVQAVTEANAGVGIQGMFHRIARIQGQLEIESAPGKTRLVVRLPATAPTA